MKASLERLYKKNQNGTRQIVLIAWCTGARQLRWLRQKLRGLLFRGRAGILRSFLIAWDLHATARTSRSDTVKRLAGSMRVSARQKVMEKQRITCAWSALSLATRRSVRCGILMRRRGERQCVHDALAKWLGMCARVRQLAVCGERVWAKHTFLAITSAFCVWQSSAQASINTRSGVIKIAADWGKGWLEFAFGEWLRIYRRDRRIGRVLRRVAGGLLAKIVSGWVRQVSLGVKRRYGQSREELVDSMDQVECVLITSCWILRVLITLCRFLPGRTLVCQSAAMRQCFWEERGGMGGTRRH